MSTVLDAKLLSIFSKACYCKDTSDIPGLSASESKNMWLSEYYHQLQVLPTEWEIITIDGCNKNGVYSKYNGFQGVVYGKKGHDGNYEEIVIAYRGTDSIMDKMFADVQIFLNNFFNIYLSQASTASILYDEVRKIYGNVPITLVGHSLGGALAQYVASSHKNLKAVTFNAPGIGKKIGAYTDNIINYVNMNDVVGSFGKHAGEVRYYLPDGMYNGEYRPHSDYVFQDFEKYIK